MMKREKKRKEKKNPGKEERERKKETRDSLSLFFFRSIFHSRSDGQSHDGMTPKKRKRDRLIQLHHTHKRHLITSTELKNGWKHHPHARYIHHHQTQKTIQHQNKSQPRHFPYIKERDNRSMQSVANHRRWIWGHQKESMNVKAKNDLSSSSSPFLFLLFHLLSTGVECTESYAPSNPLESC